MPRNAFAQNAVIIGARQSSFKREPAWTVKQFEANAPRLEFGDIVSRALELVHTDTGRGKMDFMATARAIAAKVHQGQRLKFVDGVYMDEHIKPVVAQVWTPPQKALAFDHDVPERIISLINHALEEKKLPPLNFVQERAVVERTLEVMAEEFERRGFDTIKDINFFENLRALTKFASSEKGWDGYRHYGFRLVDHVFQTGDLDIVYVKKSDLENNLRADRNPRPDNQTAKVRESVERHEWLKALLNKEFPEVTLRPEVAEHADKPTWHLGHLSAGRRLVASRTKGNGLQQYGT